MQAALARFGAARRAAFWAKVGLVGCVVWTNAAEFRLSRESQAEGRKLPIAGTWTVDELRRGGELQTLAASDGALWRRVSIKPWGALLLRRADGSAQRYFAEFDTAQRTLALRPFGRHDAEPVHWTWDCPGGDRLVLRAGHEQLEATLTRCTGVRATLTSRGLRWISETPFND